MCLKPIEKNCRRRGYFIKMIKTLIKLIFGYFLFTLCACDKEIEKGVMKSDLSRDIEMHTNYGTIIMRLSDETPKHRNNFIRLVNEQFYDSLLFHRVINNFLIQTGDHNTKYSNVSMKNDSFQLPNLIDSEFRPNLFHKRGALNAARMGDDLNPSRSSSGSQFTIIQGKIHTNSTLNTTLKRVNKWLAKNNVINKAEYKSDFNKLVSLSKKIDEADAYDSDISKKQKAEYAAAFKDLKNRIDLINFDSLALIELKTMKKYSYPESHREVYKSIGGTPHLDQNYTVFGEVVKGMNVVDSIAAVATDKGDKPLNNVYIITARMIERKSYNE